MTQDELLQELINALELNKQFQIEPDTITKNEYMTSRCTSEYSAKKELDLLVGDGLLERVKIRRPNSWGDVRLVYGYRFIRKG